MVLDRLAKPNPVANCKPVANPLTAFFAQFYNEKTGETTWDQPRPALPPPTSAPGRTSAEDEGHPRRQPSTERYQAQDERRPGSVPNGKRGWFGRGRAAPTKPQQAPAAALQARQPWRSRGAGGEGMEGYGQAANHEGRTGNGSGGGGGGSEREGRFQEQWVGEGGDGWNQAGQRRDVAGVGSRQEQHGRKEGATLGPGSFGEQGPPGAFNPYEPEAREKNAAAAGWGKVEGAETWNPSTGASLATPDIREGSKTYDPAVGGGGGSSTGGGGDAGGAACAQPGGSDELIPADAADVAAAGGATAAQVATGGSPVPRSDASGGSSGWETDERRGRNGGGGISGVFLSPAATDVGGTEKAALGADSRDEAQSPLEAKTAAESASAEGGDMESQRRHQQQQALQTEQGLTEKGREGGEETLQAITVTSLAEDNTGRKDKTGEEAGPSTDGMGEWFSPPQDVGGQNAIEAPRNPAWGEKSAGGVGGRAQTANGDASKLEGGETLPVRQEDVQASAIGGEGSGSLGQEEQLWGFGFQPQPQPPQQQQQQPQQQQQYGGDGVRHEAEGWDWADPWGQGETWGAPGTRRNWPLPEAEYSTDVESARS